jgi:hypothetical protein
MLQRQQQPRLPTFLQQPRLSTALRSEIIPVSKKIYWC